jgi:hypothetical protein
MNPRRDVSNNNEKAFAKLAKLCGRKILTLSKRKSNFAP